MSSPDRRGRSPPLFGRVRVLFGSLAVVPNDADEAGNVWAEGQRADLPVRVETIERFKDPFVLNQVDSSCELLPLPPPPLCF